MTRKRQNPRMEATARRTLVPQRPDSATTTDTSPEAIGSAVAAEADPLGPAVAAADRADTAAAAMAPGLDRPGQPEAAPAPNADAAPEVAPDPDAAPDADATPDPAPNPDAAPDLAAVHGTRAELPRAIAQAPGAALIPATGSGPNTAGSELAAGPEAVAVDEAASSRAAVPDPGVRIEIDPTVRGGHVHGRFDIMIRGRAMSVAPIEQVRLEVAHRVTSLTSYGKPERAAVAVLPDGTAARQHGFQFNLARSGSGRPETCRFQIIARTEGGIDHTVDFEIAVDPAADDSVSVIAGATRRLSGAARPDTVAYVETARIDPDGVLLVEGWAVAMVPILGVQVFAGEDHVATAKKAIERTDVAAIFPLYPNARLSGFSAVVQLDSVNRDTEYIRARIICQNGFGHEETIPVEHGRGRNPSSPVRARGSAELAVAVSGVAASAVASSRTDKSRTVDPRTADPGTADLRTAEMGSAATEVAEAGSSETKAVGTGSTETTVVEIGSAETEVVEPRSSEITVVETGSAETTVVKTGSSETKAVKPGSSETKVAEPKSADAGSSQTKVPETESADPGSSQTEVPETGAAATGSAERAAVKTRQTGVVAPKVVEPVAARSPKQPPVSVGTGPEVPPHAAAPLFDRSSPPSDRPGDDLQNEHDPPLEKAVPAMPPASDPEAADLERLLTSAVPAPQPPAPMEEPPAEIRMHCDVAELTTDGTLWLTGWAVCRIGIIQVRVLLDGQDVGLASTGHERPDVGDIFPDIPIAGLAGFRFQQRIGDRFEGAHEVRVIVRNFRNEEHAKQLTVVAAMMGIPAPVLIQATPDEAEVAEPTGDEGAEFRFELDAPEVSSGAAVALITGRLTIDGWLLTRSGIASFEIFLDGHRLGDAHYGLARQDVGAAFPDWPNSLRSGYAFHCPPRSLRNGDHAVQLRIRSQNGQELIRAFQITVQKADDQQDSMGVRRRVPRVEADMMAAFLSDMGHRPFFQFILRQDRSIGIDRLRATLDALRSQAYDDWACLVLAEDGDVAMAVQVVIDALVPHLAARFSVITPLNIAAWSAPLAHVGAPAGSYVGASADGGQPLLCSLLLPGDEPGADALLELAVAGGRHPDQDLLYCDEVRVSPVSKDRESFFKPDFSPDLLLSTNYIGRLWVATAALLTKTSATPASLMAHGEYDLLLRCSELAGGVHHVAKLLCRRWAEELDNPVLEKAALEHALDRRGIAAQVLATPIEGTWRVRRAVPSKGKVSIIIPTCAAHGYIETCITTLRAKTRYRDFEIICIDNIPDADVAWKVWLQKNADKVVEIPDAFNWSIFNNRAADVADGEFLLFLNDDIEIIQDDWLDAMMEHARRPEVGITGPQLLYRDGKVQHAGMFLSNNGIGRHAFRFAAGDDPCYFGLALTQRNVMAVTGACMLVRRETFERLGRFDEAHQIVNNDLDFCLRVHRAGLLTVFTPYAALTHYELASRASMKDVFDMTHFNAAWKTTFAAGDPYFSPRLSRHADDYRPDDEPVQWVVAGAPIFLAEEIQRILVVKLDHIGDFVTALPPIRRLKKLFPHARITVLAGPASRAFVALESCIDEFIPFAFFHARSQLGERELSTDDYAELAGQLRSYRFDLAVDLRKHLSTRDVLKHTGARFLAGFDYLGQFPYLDVALDWDGDRTLQRKRSHVVDDLMALVNAIGHAAETDRVIMQPGPAAMALTELPDQVRALFVRPVVAIHPGAGNVTKQWPEEHFSALIDLLVEKNGVSIMLVGGPDEVEVADALLVNVQHPDMVASMAGKTSLADLPRLLKICALYIGNDSGPKHIAAAVGIPTIGIHSGVVDPVEWGPIGPNAVALRRNMTCSPCYLAKAEDCPRSLACLRFFEPNLVYETADLLLRRPGPVIVTAEAAEPRRLEQTHPERDRPVPKVARQNEEPEHTSRQARTAIEEHQVDQDRPVPKVARENRAMQRAEFSAQSASAPDAMPDPHVPEETVIAKPTTSPVVATAAGPRHQNRKPKLKRRQRTKERA